jgi:hypothetical protein
MTDTKKSAYHFFIEESRNKFYIILCSVFLVFYFKSLILQNNFDGKYLFILSIIINGMSYYFNWIKSQKVYKQNIDENVNKYIKISKIFISSMEEIRSHFNNINEYKLWQENLIISNESYQSNLSAILKYNDPKSNEIFNLHLTRTFYSQNIICDYQGDSLLRIIHFDERFGMVKISIFIPCKVIFENPCLKQFFMSNQTCLNFLDNYRKNAKFNSGSKVTDDSQINDISISENTLTNRTRNTITAFGKQPKQLLEETLIMTEEEELKNILPSKLKQIELLKNSNWLSLENKIDFQSFYYDHPSGLRALKSEAYINKSMEFVLDYVKDFNFKNTWDKKFETGHNIKEVDDFMIQYLRYKGALIVSPRDFIVAIHKKIVNLK